MEKFERFVSIGSFCITKFQINRYIIKNYFGLSKNNAMASQEIINKFKNNAIENSKFKKINGGNLFFDWVVVYDYKKIIKLLNTGFNYDLSVDNLVENKSSTGEIKNIKCNISGIFWNHLFSKNNNFLDWKDQVDDLKPKVNHLMRNFRDLDKYKTLYIINLRNNGYDAEMPAELYNALSTLRKKSTKNFKLLICVGASNARQNFPDHENILFRSYDPTPDFNSYPWLSNASSWDQVLSDFSLDGFGIPRLSESPPETNFSTPNL